MAPFLLGFLAGAVLMAALIVLAVRRYLDGPRD